MNKAAQYLKDKWDNSSVGQFCQKAVNTVTEFYEKNKTVINFVFGAAVIAVCAVAAVATGGATCWVLATVFAIGVGVGRGTVGALGSALDYMEDNGTIDGSTEQVLEGFSSGFAKGTVEGAISGFALGKYIENTKYMKDPQAYCFVAGTLIVTTLGLANIEDIRPGDYVYTENTETGEQDYMPVLETFSHEVSETYTITIEGEPIETTSGHPFYVVEEGWVGANELEAGDEVELADGGSGTVDSVEKNELDEPVMVYNFAVMDYHTYYVGENGALVHNKCNADVDTPNAGGPGGQTLPESGSGSNIASPQSIQQTPDQKALHDLAKESVKNARNGNPISYEEAQILDEWAVEYNVLQHHQAYPGSGEHFPGGNYMDHTHIYNIHVPYEYR